VAKPTLPTQKDPIYAWVYDNVHAIYAEHWADIYDKSADGSLSLAIALTYRAVQALLESQGEDDDGPEEDEQGGEAWPPF
jgi:hypothetical protein